MGRSMAIAFAENGADLLLTDLNAEGVQATAEHIHSLGRRAIPTTYDVTDIDQIREMFALLDREFGKIDVLGNVFGPGYLAHPEDIPLTEVDRVLHGLVDGALLLLPGSREADAGGGQGQHHQHRLDCQRHGQWDAATSPTAWGWAPWRR